MTQKLSTQELKAILIQAYLDAGFTIKPGNK